MQGIEKECKEGKRTRPVDNASCKKRKDLWVRKNVFVFLCFFVFLLLLFIFCFFVFFFSLMAAVPVGMGNRFLLPHSTSILRVQSLRHWLVSAQRTLSPQGCVLRGCHIPPRSILMVFGVRCSHFFVEDLSPDTGP